MRATIGSESRAKVYDPIPYASEQGSYFWPSRELNRVIRELIRLISEPRDLAVISIHLNRVSEQLVHDEQGARRKPSFTYPEGIPRQSSRSTVSAWEATS